ncbi:MAG: lipocalin-like domain-containing protein, partial [Pseudomonadota bacterium]|nr:lipocalin-like domain-containing protein [Pseudomonadota bacterium]
MDNLHGTWALIETAATDCDGRPLDPPYGGPAALGRVTFGRDGRMVAVICDGRAEPPAGAPRAYMSYCGRFTYDGETLITRVDAAGDPARLGSDQLQYLEALKELGENPPAGPSAFGVHRWAPRQGGGV